MLATVTKAEEEFSRVPSLKKDCSVSIIYDIIIITLHSRFHIYFFVLSGFQHTPSCLAVLVE